MAAPPGQQIQLTFTDYFITSMCDLLSVSISEYLFLEEYNY